MQKLLGFLPDSDPTTPGALIECINFIPYNNGMMGAPTGQTPTDAPVLAAECRGATVVTKLDASRRIIAGTQTKLYELAGGTWSDVSKAGSYVGGTDSRWSFTQFGDTTIAANGVEAIQQSSSGAFATIATAPIADIVFAVGSFVMALGTEDATYGNQPDRWWCSATYDATSWTPSLTTLATTGRLVSAPGPILAGGRLGEYAIVYKQRSIYIGQFVGAPEVWSFTQVPGGEAGCVGKEAWCEANGVHVFVGADNIYAFDGTRPVPIGTGEVRDWFFANSNPNYLYKTKCVFDRRTNAVWIFYPSLTSTVCDQVLVHHLGTKQWGCATLTVEAVLDYTASGTTITGLDAISATIDGLSAYSFDSSYWLAGGRSLSIVNASHQLQLMTGNTTTSGCTTGDVGDDEAVTLLSKLRVRFAPGYVPAATVQMFSKMTEGDGLTNGVSGTLADGKFDVLQSARFHRMALSFTGPVRVLSVGAETKIQGNR